MRRSKFIIACVACVVGLCSVAVRTQAAEPKFADAVTFQPDIEYAKIGDVRVTLDLCLPKEPKEKALPLIVYIHGGGWYGGNKSIAWNRGLQKYVESGEYAAAAISYRFSNVATWPACIHDCKAAIRWLKAHAKEYGIDPDRIGVVGGSAGGHLLSLVCTSSDVKELEGDEGNLNYTSRVACGVDEVGPTDFISYMDFKRPEKSLLSPGSDNSPEYRLFGGPIADRKETLRAASPLTYVTKDDPPMMIAHGADDPIVPIQQSEVFYASLQKAGVPAVYLRIEGLGHTVSCPEYDRQQKLFFDKYLRGAKVDVPGGTVQAGPPQGK